MDRYVRKPLGHERIGRHTGLVLLDDDTCYRAMVARDPRFDGRFMVGVLTTGVYCRPVCPARTPLRRNVRFFATAAAASAAGLRSCKRCRPDSLPGSREWDYRTDLVARALRLIAAGEADDGVGRLAQRLGVSERHLRREIRTELGTTPSRLSRTRRAQTARLLVEQTDLPMTEIAFAAGFRSLRQFNDVMRDEFGAAPGGLRRRGVDRSRASDQPGMVALSLRHREPYDRSAMLAWLARHAVPGVDDVDAQRQEVTTTAVDGTRVVVGFGPGAVSVVLTGPPGGDLSWLPGRVASLRHWLDLDANPAAVAAGLERDPASHQIVAARPGVRVVGALDPFRGLITTILAQRVSVATAGTQAGRFVQVFAGGGPVRFPTADLVAAADPLRLSAALGVTRAKGRTLVAAASAVAEGRLLLHHDADRDEVVARLAAVPGIGPWTIGDLRMRVLADPDVWPAGDLVLRRAVGAGGIAAGMNEQLVTPWRSYAAHQVWVAVAAERERARGAAA